MKTFLLLSLLLLTFVVTSVPAQTETPAKGKTKWVYLYLHTSGGTEQYGPLMKGGQHWKAEVPRKVPMLLITKPFEVPDTGWDPCLEADFRRQFGAHLLAKQRANLMKLELHRTRPIQSDVYYPDRPTSVQGYTSWKLQKGNTVAGVPYEVIEINDFKFQTMATYPCIRDAKLNAELEKIIGTGIL